MKTVASREVGTVLGMVNEGWLGESWRTLGRIDTEEMTVVLGPDELSVLTAA